MSTADDQDPAAVGDTHPFAGPLPPQPPQSTPPPQFTASSQSAAASGFSSEFSSAPPHPTSVTTPPPGLSLIDLAVGVGSLAVRVSLIPVRVAVRVAHGPGPSRSAADTGAGAIDAPAVAANPLADWSAWAVRSVAQVGKVERGRVRNTARSLVGSVTSAIAADPDIGRMVRELAGSQLDPILDQALPRVLDRLAEDPVAVRRIVQDQSVGIMTEAADSARGTTRHADQAVDNLVAKLLHRRPQAGTGAANGTRTANGTAASRTGDANGTTGAANGASAGTTPHPTTGMYPNPTLGATANSASDPLHDSAAAPDLSSDVDTAAADVDPHARRVRDVTKP